MAGVAAALVVYVDVPKVSVDSLHDSASARVQLDLVMFGMLTVLTVMVFQHAPMDLMIVYHSVSVALTWRIAVLDLKLNFVMSPAPVRPELVDSLVDYVTLIQVVIHIINYGNVYLKGDRSWDVKIVVDQSMYRQ
jgi:type IV secretory pathway VirB2 component (pilin)